MSAFCKKSAFFGENSIFTQSNSVRAVMEIFLVLFSVFVIFLMLLLMKMYVFQTICLESSFWIAPNWPNCSKNDNDVIICRHDIIVKFFVYLFLLSSVVAGPSFMSVSSLVLGLWQFFLWGIDQKSEDWKYPLLRFSQHLEIGLS